MSRIHLPESAWIALLLLFLCCIYPPAVISEQAAGQSFLKGDCVYYRAIIVSLLQDHDLQMANNAPRLDDGQLALGRDGLVPKHPILMPIVSIPFYVLFGDFGLLLFNFFSKYDDWGKSHFSNRFLMTAVALSSVFAGNALAVLLQKFALTDSSKPAVVA